MLHNIVFKYGNAGLTFLILLEQKCEINPLALEKDSRTKLKDKIIIIIETNLFVE